MRHLFRPTIKHLLRLRSLEKVTLDVAFLENRPDHILEERKESIIKALEVLKEPYEPATLKKQEMKDKRKSRRTVLGKPTSPPGPTPLNK